MLLENHSPSCCNCDRWRVRKTGGGRSEEEQCCGVAVLLWGGQLNRTEKSCHAWLWSQLTVGPLCFTDPLTACLVVFQEENRSWCRLHQKITSPRLRAHPSSPLCVIWRTSSTVAPCRPALGLCDWADSLVALLDLNYVTMEKDRTKDWPQLDQTLICSCTSFFVRLYITLPQLFSPQCSLEGSWNRSSSTWSSFIDKFFLIISPTYVGLKTKTKSQFHTNYELLIGPLLKCLCWFLYLLYQLASCSLG